MKALSKPTSSPGRMGNFQPPLMRFLRGNAGSKSRKGRKSRSSPIFYIRSKEIEAIQEPSSPKVTCIGQVRESHSAATVSRRRLPCWLLKKIKTLFSGEKSSGIQKRGFSRWDLFFGSGYCKKGAETEDSCRVYCNQKSEKSENILDHDCKDTNNVSFCPPRNAVVLTRCRSDPYKPSSLGGLFWSSSLLEGGGIENDAELQKPSWEKSRNYEEDDNSMKMENILVNNFQELKGNVQGGAVLHPLLLTRCKSEPARRLVAV